MYTYVKIICICEPTIVLLPKALNWKPPKYLPEIKKLWEDGIMKLLEKLEKLVESND